MKDAPSSGSFARDDVIRDELNEVSLSTERGGKSRETSTSLSPIPPPPLPPAPSPSPPPPPTSPSLAIVVSAIFKTDVESETREDVG